MFWIIAGRSNDEPVLVSCGAARFRFKMFMMPRFPGPLEEKQPDNITERPPPAYLHRGYFRYCHSSFYAKSTLSVGCRKADFLFYLTIEHGSSQSSSSISRFGWPEVSTIVEGAVYWKQFADIIWWTDAGLLFSWEGSICMPMPHFWLYLSLGGVRWHIWCITRSPSYCNQDHAPRNKYKPGYNEEKLIECIYHIQVHYK